MSEKLLLIVRRGLHLDSDQLSSAGVGQMRHIRGVVERLFAGQLQEEITATSYAVLSLSYEERDFASARILAGEVVAEVVDVPISHPEERYENRWKLVQAARQLKGMFEEGKRLVAVVSNGVSGVYLAYELQHEFTNEYTLGLEEPKAGAGHLIAVPTFEVGPIQGHVW